MYIIRPPPTSTRLAKDSARAVVASEQASAIIASNFTTCVSWLFALRLQFTCSMSGDFRKSQPVSFYWARRRNVDANQLFRAIDPNGSVTVPMSALCQKRTCALVPLNARCGLLPAEQWKHGFANAAACGQSRNCRSFDRQSRTSVRRLRA